MGSEKAIKAIKENIAKVIIGKEHVTDLILTSLIAGGHVLLEDVPGTGKTVMAKSLAKSVGCDFSRIQFTPDLLPSDVTGINYFNQKEGEFVFRKGPVFTGILLADEINRATPRTQSSLLECMEEKQVTIDGETTKLEAPFFVIATENPVETAGTFPLPEAQLDRFLMQISMGEPTKEEEVAIMNRFLKDSPLESLDVVCTKEELLEMQKAYKDVFVHPLIMDYIADIVAATRNSDNIVMGVSPRGTLALLNTVRAYAMVKGRDYVTPEDVKELTEPVLAHRLVLQRGLNAKGAAGVLADIVANVNVPTENWR
ncbi:MAG: MoxR family ATPase [Lachnospiraceae bacterium]|nr:MoxR family ATPase [Lachnospiraceae bacterium]